VAQQLNFKNNINYHWRANRQALHSVDQSNVSCLSAEKLDEKFRCSICNSRMFREIFGRRDQHCQLHKFLQPVQITKMFHSGCQRVERSDVRGFLALLDGKISPRRPEMASFPFTTGSVPLRKSKFPASEDST
jgi:hypothetical protein